MFLLQGTQKFSKLGDLEKKRQYLKGKVVGFFHFIELLADQGYSCEFLSFVAHRMASPHPKNKPKREQERILAMWGREVKVIFKTIRIYKTKQKKKRFPSPPSVAALPLGVINERCLTGSSPDSSRAPPRAHKSRTYTAMPPTNSSVAWQQIVMATRASASNVNSRLYRTFCFPFSSVGLSTSSLYLKDNARGLERIYMRYHQDHSGNQNKSTPIWAVKAPWAST